METQYEIEEVREEANEKVRESIAEINKVKRVASRKVSVAWEDAKKVHLREEAIKDWEQSRAKVRANAVKDWEERRKAKQLAVATVIATAREAKIKSKTTDQIEELRIEAR